MLLDMSCRNELFCLLHMGCSGWVHKRCSGVKGSLVRAKDMFICKTCERAGDEEDRNVEESLDLGNGVHLENVGKFCYLGDMLNGVEEQILHLWQGRIVHRGSLRSYQGS